MRHIAKMQKRGGERKTGDRKKQRERDIYCTVGWVNFSEFQITVCGSCKMSKKIN